MDIFAARLPALAGRQSRPIGRHVSDTLEVGPARGPGWLQVGLGLLLVGLTTTVDPAGRLLLVPAGLGLLAYAARDLLLRPVLRADVGGVTVVDGLRRRQVAWSGVERLRVVTDRRAPLIELDLGDTVVVLSRRRLGASPYVVLEQLEQLRGGPQA